MSHRYRQAMMDKAIAERQRIRNWLLPHMNVGKPKAFTKDQYRLLAVSELGPFSKAAFGDAWISAIEDTGRQDWYDPKTRRKEARQ
ncbi:hypothetical protein MCEREM21A_00624 [Sphingomonadaceae bacterium]